MWLTILRHPIFDLGHGTVVKSVEYHSQDLGSKPGTTKIYFIGINNAIERG